MTNTLANFANQLEALMAGQTTSEKLRQTYPADALGEPGPAIWRALERFIEDASRRADDADYAHMQLAQMRSLIRLLENGGDASEFATITFQDDR